MILIPNFLLLLLLLLWVTSPLTTPLEQSSDFDGLVLLKRYAQKASNEESCQGIKLGGEPNYPTSRADDIAAHVLATNGSAVVFDFEGPSLGIGNCEDPSPC